MCGSCGFLVQADADDPLTVPSIQRNITVRGSVRRSSSERVKVHTRRRESTH
jgi:hypothetical protein